jgi:hypothetical protein
MFMNSPLILFAHALRTATPRIVRQAIDKSKTNLSKTAPAFEEQPSSSESLQVGNLDHSS